jgi:hypothetical protein
MRILALAERAFDSDALLRLPLYSRSRSNDSEEKAKVIEWVFFGGRRGSGEEKKWKKVKEIHKKAEFVSEFVR